MNKPILVTGPPGSGKTTRFIEKLSNENSGCKIWVLEPVKKIVDMKNSDLQIVKDGEIDFDTINIKYINYAEGFSTAFYNKVGKSDFLVIDEAHTLFFTAFRKFDIKNIDEVLSLFHNVIFMTATPEILELYLKGKNVDYNTIAYNQRLERKKIQINFYPTKLFPFLTTHEETDYDIIATNNVKNLKKLEYKLGLQAEEFTFIYSVYNENNNLLFREPKFKDSKWIGTCALGQGIDKFITLKDKEGSVLFDGNSFKQVPDSVKDKYLKNPDDKGYYFALFKSMAENIIQTDRFRVDLDVLKIDILLDLEIDDDRYNQFKEIITKYFVSVYKSEVEFNIKNGLFARRGSNFTIEMFKECMDEYDHGHEWNMKDLRIRFLELIDVWCNPIEDGKRRRKIGQYRNTLIYFEEIFKKYYDNNENIKAYDSKLTTEVEMILFDNIAEKKKRNYVLQKGIKAFIEYLVEADLKGKSLNYLANKKDWGLDGRPSEDKINTEFYKDMAYFGESLLQILFCHYDLRYNIEDDDLRGGSPLQLLPKYLRSSLIISDIDVKGCHIVALIKKVLGDDVIITKDSIERIYSYIAYSREKILEYLKSYRKMKNLSDEEIEVGLGGERGVCKMAILWAINKLKYKKNIDFEYVENVIGGVLKDFKEKDLREYKSLGYYNGIQYEDKWLGEYNGHRGAIYRIADGLCQVYGNPERLKEIKNQITATHHIPIGYEDIKQYKKLDLDKNLDYFIQEAYNECDEVTNEMIMSSFLEVIKKMEEFRKHLLKGKSKGKAKGESKGEFKGKAVNKKLYNVLEDFTVKKTGVTYKAGLVEWDYIPKDIPKSYRVKYLKKVALLS